MPVWLLLPRMRKRSGRLGSENAPRSARAALPILSPSGSGKGRTRAILPCKKLGIVQRALNYQHLLKFM